MADQRIADALRDASDTRAVAIEAGAVRSAARVFGEWFGDAAALVVADETTWALAGEAVDATLRASGRSVRAAHVLPARPALYAKYGNVTAAAVAVRDHDAIPVAVASGTINDIVKRAAHECERPYMSVATAASMDGYTAFGAAITNDGYKRTMTCRAPRAVVADLDVLAGAPTAMTAAGYADLLGKVTAGADWLVAGALGVEPIRGPARELAQPGLRDAVGRPAELPAGERAALRALIDGLVMAGPAMTPVPDRPAPDAVERAVRAMHPDRRLADAVVAETLAKHPTPDQREERMRTLRDRWPQLHDRVDAQLLPGAELRAMLDAVGCPTAPEAIGLSRDDVRRTYARARTIRRRYTVLDLAHEAGVLDACVGELFAPGGVWS